MTRKLVSFFSMLLMVVLLVTSLIPAAVAEDTVKIGVAMATTQSTFYAKMARIIEDYCKKINVDVSIADPNYDLGKQVEAVENFIAGQCDAIIVVAFDPEGIKDKVLEAVAQGIYVMTYDGVVEGANGSLNVKQYDYGYATGSMAADWINSNETLKNQEVIEVGIFDYPTVVAIIDRATGIREALTQNCPNVKIVEQQSAALTDEGVVLGENFLQAHPNMQLICAINDNAALGAYEVWNAAGHVGDTIGFFGADADEKALELISQNTSYRGTVALTAEESLSAMIDVCVAASRGEEVEGTIWYGMAKVTSENVQDFLAK